MRTGPGAHLPVAELEHSVLLDNLLDGLRAGDVRALLTDDHSLAVRIDGSEAWNDYGPGTHFNVPSRAGFDIVVSSGIAEYVCSFE